MNKLAFVMAPLLLAGCSSPPAEEAPDVEPATEAAETAGMVSANGSPPGTYEVTAADGTVTRTVLNADGTYTDMAEDGTVLAEGTWVIADGKSCFTPSTEGVDAMCFTESAPAEDGSFTVTPDEGEPATVRPVTVEEVAPAE
jgi:hypothetical protein